MSSLGYSAVLKPGEGVSVTIDGKTYAIASDALNYKDVVDALRDGASKETVANLVTPKRLVETKAAAQGLRVDINEDTDTVRVFHGENEIKGLVADRIIDLVRSNHAFDALKRFVEKALTNRDLRAIDQLYKFMENNHCTLHPDGDILAFKAVRSDYWDYHSRTVHYALGSVVKMDREKCDADPNASCSRGLHVGGRRYVMSNYSASDRRVLIIKVHPANFVAVPNHDTGKARVCELLVYAEIDPKTLDTALKDFVTVIEDGERFVAKLKDEARANGGTIEFVPEGETFDDALPANDLTPEAVKPKKAKSATKNAAPTKKPVKKPSAKSAAKKAKAEKEAPKLAEKVATFKLVRPTDPEFVFRHEKTGKQVTHADLVSLVTTKGQREAARITGIPRTTLQDWLKIAKGE